MEVSVRDMLGGRARGVVEAEPLREGVGLRRELIRIFLVTGSDSVLDSGTGDLDWRVCVGVGVPVEMRDDTRFRLGTRGLSLIGVVVFWPEINLNVLLDIKLVESKI